MSRSLITDSVKLKMMRKTEEKNKKAAEANKDDRSFRQLSSNNQHKFKKTNISSFFFFLPFLEFV